MTVELDYTSPNVKFSYDLNQSPLVKFDQHNLINVLGKKTIKLVGSSVPAGYIFE